MLLMFLCKGFSFLLLLRSVSCSLKWVRIVCRLWLMLDSIVVCCLIWCLMCLCMRMKVRLVLWILLVLCGVKFLGIFWFLLKFLVVFVSVVIGWIWLWMDRMEMLMRISDVMII